MDVVANPEREDLRAQLEAEHAERLNAFSEKRDKGRDRAKARQERKQHEQDMKVELAERVRFYKEKGYKKYVDSRGREHWLLPDEYAWRLKARKAREERNKRYGTPNTNTRGTEYWLMGIAAILAVMLGLFLIR
jgi:hypothetical protein